jgi:type II secretory pathway component PulK
MFYQTYQKRVCFRIIQNRRSPLTPFLLLDVLEFVKHHAQRGYELEASQLMDIQLSASDEFSIELYNYLLQNNAIDSQNTHILAACVICFPNGKCVDICDTGVHP